MMSMVVTIVLSTIAALLPVMVLLMPCASTTRAVIGTKTVLIPHDERPIASLRVVPQGTSLLVFILDGFGTPNYLTWIQHKSTALVPGLNFLDTTGKFLHTAPLDSTRIRLITSPSPLAASSRRILAGSPTPPGTILSPPLSHHSETTWDVPDKPDANHGRTIF